MNANERLALTNGYMSVATPIPAILADATHDAHQLCAVTLTIRFRTGKCAQNIPKVHAIAISMHLRLVKGH